MELNLQKSHMFGMNVEPEEKARLANCMGCLVQSFPTKHLGLPLVKGQMKKDDWAPLVERFEKRLARWKGRYGCTGIGEKRWLTMNARTSSLCKEVSRALDWELGGGSVIQFWTDRWCGEERLGDVAPDLFRLSSNKEGRVDKFFQGRGSGGGWTVALTRARLGEAEARQFENLMTMLDRFVPADMNAEANNLFTSTLNTLNNVVVFAFFFVPPTLQNNASPTAGLPPYYARRGHPDMLPNRA
ncbi:hypothetical protein QJS10_CPA03g01216 [Acorus calamus]|uniref:Uncharacterized protein n=1 Tax=Acorus calamus TaxID=4465 RepID=A0AAV9FD02_ACOCL|nr:hypothetical protein QJS10_CPA03g01216 [Acorus calamus]